LARPPVRVTDCDDPRIAPFRAVRERDIVGREGRFIAEGTVVLRMLAAAHHASCDFTAEAILLLENRVAGVADVLAQFGDDVPVYVADAAVFDAIAGFNMHRGVLAIGRRGAVPTLAERVAALPEQSLVLAACGISNHDNVGSMFRNAAAFSADAVLLDRTSCDPLYRKAIRVSVGSVLSVPFSREESVEAMLDALAGAGFDIWALSPGGAVPIGDVRPGPRVALVVGTEGEGLPRAVLDRFRSVRIPQAPGLDSLNVATASGIALYHFASAAGRLA
jgi:tRNA G18 (ribose-2'-O)-methylase SpoU